MDAGRFAAGFAAGWRSRPWTLQLYGGASLALFAYSAITEDPLDLFAIVGMLLFLTLLWNLWKGESAMWWLFLILTGAGAAIALTVAFDEPVAWFSFGVCAVGLCLLVAEPTKAFVRQQ